MHVAVHPLSTDNLSKRQVKDAAEKAMDDLKSENPDIDTNAIKVDVPTVNPPNLPYQAQHQPLGRPLPPLPALRPQAYAPAPANPGPHLPNPALGLPYQPAAAVMAAAFGPGPGHNPVGRYPPPIGVPWQFPPYMANPAPQIGNPQMHVPIPAPPAPVATVRANAPGNRQPRNQPKRPAGRARRR